MYITFRMFAKCLNIVFETIFSQISFDRIVTRSKSEDVVPSPSQPDSLCYERSVVEERLRPEFRCNRRAGRCGLNYN